MITLPVICCTKDENTQPTAQVRDAMSRPPVFCPSDDGRMTPYVDSVTSTSILLELCLSTAGSVHYVVLTQGCSPPSPEQALPCESCVLPSLASWEKEWKKTRKMEKAGSQEKGIPGKRKRKEANLWESFFMGTWTR